MMKEGECPLQPGGRGTRGMMKETHTREEREENAERQKILLM